MRDIGELQAAGAFGTSHSQVSSGGGIASGGGKGMMPIGGELNVSLGSVDSVFKGEGIDSMFSVLAPGGGVFSQTITDQIAGVVNQHVTAEAKGDQGMKLESLGQGERVAPPNVQGDLQMKKIGVIGGGGAEH